MADLQYDSRKLLNLMILRIPGLRTAERAKLSYKLNGSVNPDMLTKRSIEEEIQRPFKIQWKMDDIKREAESDYACAARRNVQMTCLWDNDYPPLLREIADPPAILFYRGVLPNPEQPLAAMVGTRGPTSAAMSLAYKLGKELGEYGIPVVSGLALGIDTMSLRGNADAGAPSIAVLGSGVDQVYPALNRPLAKLILEKGGLLVSEYPPEMGPRKWHFPERNRIISALARGTIIVEAPEKSGALITADFAIEQGRDLWVTRTGVNSFKGKGTAKLAADGAKVIESAQEIMAEWGLLAQKDTGPEPVDTQTPVGTQTPAAAATAALAGKILASDLARSLNIENILDDK